MSTRVQIIVRDVKLHAILTPEMMFGHFKDHWRFVNLDQDGSTHNVGPLYPTKELLLADMRRYLTEYGFAI